ncbi:MAG: hypothetical protein QM621_08440, partial [Aeromicrobium sp.]|uniref:hypothetical protein n=1 Tax=Aeromicrobium sp. TaxID=1871063 RepID=UPI0039E47270
MKILAILMMTSILGFPTDLNIDRTPNGQGIHIEAERYTPGKAWSTPSRPWTNTTNQNTTPATATTRPLALACAIGDP